MMTSPCTDQAHELARHSIGAVVKHAVVHVRQGRQNAHRVGALRRRRRAVRTDRVQELHERLHDTYPVLQGNLSIPGMVGHGLGAFVANGMSDDQIVAHVLGIVRHIRQTVGSAQELCGFGHHTCDLGARARHAGSLICSTLRISSSVTASNDTPLSPPYSRSMQ